MIGGEVRGDATQPFMARGRRGDDGALRDVRRRIPKVRAIEIRHHTPRLGCDHGAGQVVPGRQGLTIGRGKPVEGPGGHQAEFDSARSQAATPDPIGHRRWPGHQQVGTRCRRMDLQASTTLVRSAASHGVEHAPGREERNDRCDSPITVAGPEAGRHMGDASSQVCGPIQRVDDHSDLSVPVRGTRFLGPHAEAVAEQGARGRFVGAAIGVVRADGVGHECIQCVEDAMRRAEQAAEDRVGIDRRSVGASVRRPAPLRP